MEEKKRSIASNALNYGLITGAVLIVYSLLLYITNLYMNQVIRSLSFLIFLAGMVWGTLEYRKKSENGFMTYGQAFNSCFLIGLFAGIIGAIYTFVFIQFIYPGLINEILEQTRVKLQDQNLNEDQIDAAMEWTRKFTTPVMSLISGLVMYTVGSVVIGLIAAIFLKKIDPNAPKSAL